jgi:transposase
VGSGGSTSTCARCESLGAELGAALARVDELDAECTSLREQLLEAVKLNELQQADLERYKEAYEQVRPNHPERVPVEQLQLAFGEMLAMLAPSPAVNDIIAQGESSSSIDGQDRPGRRSKTKRRHPHGRRRLLDLSNLETKEIELTPPEVLAAGGKGFRRVGEETSSRIARRPASYLHLIIRRLKFRRIDEAHGGASDADLVTITCNDTFESSPILIAPLPEGVWPKVMADPSAIAHVIISKYDDILPLHRQERISARDGFVLPRSTQCSWLGRAHEITYRIVDAMFADAKAHAFCIATDATGGPVRAQNKCASWDVFVFLADRDHVVFRHVQQHATADKVKDLLNGFRGNLLVDAAPIYDALFETGDIIEHCCWYHCRRYFYRALETDRARALGPLSLIAKLFEIDRECSSISDPAEYTDVRARRSKPVLALLDDWMDRHRDLVDPRGPLDKAIGYYENQRDALHRFTEDSRIRLSNNLAEQQLRNLAQGRNNWNFFANETGVRWYTTFRSLIASSRLHKLNPEKYLEEVLRLAPHWPVTRVLELAPKNWPATREKLDARQRSIITRPWDSAAPLETPTSAASRSPPLSRSA